MIRRVLVTGSGGFVGGHVVAAARAAAGVRLRLLVRTAPPERGSPPDGGTPAEYVRGDLTDPGSLAGVCDGVDAVVHCASLVGGTPTELRQVNDLGTFALVAEARRAGVERFVHLSTAAVHGRGPFRGARPGRVPIAPASETSRTRAAAERHVLAAGGVVLRPHLVHGAGDRWVVPGALTLLRALGARPEGPLGRQSAIDAGTLGRALLSAATTPVHEAGRVHFVSHPEPVPGAELLAAVADTYGLFPRSVPGVPLGVARTRLCDRPVARHHLELLAVDHWFTDDDVWSRLGLDPGPPFAETFLRHTGGRPAPDGPPGASTAHP